MTAWTSILDPYLFTVWEDAKGDERPILAPEDIPFFLEVRFSTGKFYNKLSVRTVARVGKEHHDWFIDRGAPPPSYILRIGSGSIFLFWQHESNTTRRRVDVDTVIDSAVFDNAKPTTLDSIYRKYSILDYCTMQYDISGYEFDPVSIEQWPACICIRDARCNGTSMSSTEVTSFWSHDGGLDHQKGGYAHRPFVPSRLLGPEVVSVSKFEQGRLVDDSQVTEVWPGTLDRRDEFFRYMRGGRHPLSVQYFDNPEDQLVWIDDHVPEFS